MASLMQVRALLASVQTGHVLRVFQENPETCLHITAPVVKVQATRGQYQSTQIVARSELDGSDGNGMSQYVLQWAVNQCTGSIAARDPQ